MKRESANALAWFAAILLFAGWLVMSPSGAFAIFVLAALFSAVPAIFGSKKARIIAAILLLVSILFAAIKYPEFKSEQDRFSGRASGENDLAKAVRTAVINKRAGGMGLISGRKAFQWPLQDGVELLHVIQDVYLEKTVTVA